MGAGETANGAKVQCDTEACERLLLFAATLDAVKAGERSRAFATIEYKIGRRFGETTERGETSILEVTETRAAKQTRDVQTFTLYCAEQRRWWHG